MHRAWTERGLELRVDLVLCQEEGEEQMAEVMMVDLGQHLGVVVGEAQLESSDQRRFGRLAQLMMEHDRWMEELWEELEAQLDRHNDTDRSRHHHRLANSWEGLV